VWDHFLVSGRCGWPCVSTWIGHPPLNGFHFIKFLHYVGRILLNLALGKPLALVKKSPYFENLIKLYVLLVGSLDLGFHDLIDCSLLNVSVFKFCMDQVFYHLWAIQ